MTETTQKDPKPGGETRWLRRLLVASLAVNVLIVGLMAGALLRDGRDHRRHPPVERSAMRDGGLMPFYNAMPRDARGRFAEAFRESRGGGKPDRAALAADFRAFVGALRAEPFVADDLAGVLEGQRARVQARVTAGREILIAQIAAMSPAERAAFADALEDRFREDLSRMGGREGRKNRD